MPVSFAGPSRRYGAAGRARPGTTVPGGIARASGDSAGDSVRVVMRRVGSSLGGDDTTAVAALRVGATRPHQSRPDPRGPPAAVPGDTAKTSRGRSERVTSGPRARIIRARSGGTRYRSDVDTDEALHRTTGSHGDDLEPVLRASAAVRRD